MLRWHLISVSLYNIAWSGQIGFRLPDASYTIMRLGRVGSLELHIVRRSSVRQLGTRSAALGFLNRLESNPTAMRRLRHFVSEGGADPGPLQAGEGAKLERLSDLIVAGDVFFGPGECEPYWRHEDSSRSKSAALTFLGQLKAIPEAIWNLRNFVSKSTFHSDLSRVRDEEILGQVAEWIATEEVLVGFRRLLRGGGAVAEEFAATSTPRQDAAAARQASGGV